MPPDPVSEVPVKIVHLDRLPPNKQRTWTGWRVFGGLMWCEWYAHSKLLLFFLAAWLACVWVLPLYGNPAWILLFGTFYAILAGPIYGGSDTLEGVEEFTLALPPTRRQRYL